MEIFYQHQDAYLFGSLLKSFPQGIPEAFNTLMQRIPDGKNRAYYGISRINESGNVCYYTMVAAHSLDEGEKYGSESFKVEKGKYLAVGIHNWKQNTDCIKGVFHTLMQDERTDKDKPCIEWYYSNDDMRCMLKLLPATEKPPKQ